jgi:hypothetical protein
MAHHAMDLGVLFFRMCDRLAEGRNTGVRL